LEQDPKAADDGYLAFYTISEEEHLVIVVRFLFKKSNWNAILRQGFLCRNAIDF
jgi:hypothetical protein